MSSRAKLSAFSLASADTGLQFRKLSKCHTAHRSLSGCYFFALRHRRSLSHIAADIGSLSAPVGDKQLTTALLAQLLSGSLSAVTGRSIRDLDVPLDNSCSLAYFISTELHVYVVLRFETPSGSLPGLHPPANGSWQNFY